MALTDISGIGNKTAEKLREQGITSKEQLLQAFRDNDSRVVGGPFDDGLNKRALDGIRDELTSSGAEFVDPVFGVPVSEENQQAFDAFNLELGSDVAEGFGQFTRNNPRYQDMNVLDAAGKAISGELGGLNPGDYEDIATENDLLANEGPRESDEESTARKEAFEFGLDAAANLSPFERQTLEKGNNLAQQTGQMGSLTVEQTETVERETSQGTIEAEENMSVQSRDYARARKKHTERSPEARRVDNRRKAEVTNDYNEWAEDPSRHDYPGIDTPGGRQDIVTEDQRDQARQIEEIMMGADDDVTEVAFGNPLDEMF